MANPQELQALFSGVLTPLQLDAQKQAKDAQMLQAYGQDTERPWRLVLAQSLQNLGAALPNSPERRQQAEAQGNQQVLARATRAYADKVRGGATPDEAQMAVLSNAIDEFAGQGNWEAVQSLAPQLQAMQDRQAQIAKLKQDQALTGEKILTEQSTRAKDAAQTADIATNNDFQERQTKAQEANAASRSAEVGAEVLSKNAVNVKLKGDAANIYQAQRGPDGRLFIPTDKGKQYLGIGDYTVVDKSQEDSARENAVNQRFTDRLVNAASQSASAIQNLAGLTKNTKIISSGLFGREEYNGSILNASKNALANKLTSQDTQLYNSTIAGLTASLAQLDLSGTGINATYIKELQKGIRVDENDTYLTSTEKIAKAKQIYTNAVGTLLARNKITPEEKALLTKQLNDVNDAVPFDVKDVIDYRDSNAKGTMGQFMDSKRKLSGGVSPYDDTDLEAEYQNFKRTGKLNGAK